MTLLLISERRDELLDHVRPFFHQVIHIPSYEYRLADYSHIDCVLINTDAYDLRNLIHLKRAFSEVPSLMVAHTDHDCLLGIKADVDGFILDPYDADQIRNLFSKLFNTRHVSFPPFAVSRSVDPLTMLFDSQALYDILDRQEEHKLLLIDIDNFDTVNTLYGMKLGDKLLKKVAQYLKKIAPYNSTLHRVSADEFAIVLYDAREGQVGRLADEIKSFFEIINLKIDGIDFNIRVSVGISTGRGMTLFEHAKTAVKEAKDSGRNSIVVFDETSEYLKRQKENVYWINEIKAALEEERVVAYYQPIFDNHLKRVLKFESLCRIITRDGRTIEPRYFLQAALMGGLITNITRAMIDNAFQMFAGLKQQFSINITKEDFSEGYLGVFLIKKCEQYEIKPEQVFIEIVESVSFEANHGCIDQIRDLQTSGFKIAIDDFGVESSNYSRLLNIDASYLKIDGRFIQKLETDNNSRLIVENIVALAKKIGAKTIAEYVDSPQVYQSVCRLGVDYSQGYYIGRPDAIPRVDGIA